MTAPAAAGNRRAAIMGAVGGGLLLIVLIGTRLVGGGGGSDTTSPTLPPSGLGTTSTTTPASPEPGDVETFEVFTTKNPFTPLSGGGTGSTTGGTGSTSGGSTTGGSTSGGSTTGGSSSGGGTTATTVGTGSGGSSEPTRSQRVALLDIFVESGRTMANVRVDDIVYKVGEGEAFATRYRVVSLSTSDDCGRFVFGDDQFRLCKGEEVLK